MYADEPTLQASRISFTRICMVMDVEEKFPDKIRLVTEFGKEFESLRLRSNIVGILRNATNAKKQGMGKKSAPWVWKLWRWGTT